jgi:membrane protein involved in colicin uptake
MPSNRDLTEAILKLDPNAAVDGLNNVKLETLLSSLKTPAPSNNPVMFDSAAEEAKKIAEAEAKAQAEAKARADAEADVAAKTASDAEAKRAAKLKAEAEAEAKAQAEAKARADAEADVAAKTASDAEAKRAAKLKAEAEAEAKAQAEANAATEAARKGDATHKIVEGKAITCLRGLLSSEDSEELGAGRVSKRDFSQGAIDLNRLVDLGILVKL